jgi:PAS domain S-box-containing protein
MERDLPPVSARKPTSNLRLAALRYGGAVAAVVAATWLRWILQDVLGDTLAFITFQPFVALVAMLAGGGPGVLTTVLSGVIVDTWIVAADGRRDAAEAVGIGLFTTSGLVMSAMGEMLRRARRRERADLEEQVAERTSDLQQTNLTLQNEIRVRQRMGQTLRESEHRFRMVFEHAPTGIAITNLDGTFEGCNPAFCELLGYSEAELRPVDFLSLVHPSDREQNLADVRRLLAGEVSSFELENRYVDKAGRAVWVRKWVSVLPNEAGRPAHFLALVTDMTGRRRAEQTLRESEERLRLIADALPVLIAYIGADGRYQFNNAAYEDWFGLAPDACRGRLMIEVMGADAYSVVSEHVRAALAGRRRKFEARVPYRGIERRDVLAHYVPHREPGGQVLGCIALVIDLTERKQAEEALRRSEERMRAILDTAADAILTINAAGVIESVNPATERMFGYAATEMTGRDVSLLMPPPQWGEYDRSLADNLRSRADHRNAVGREAVAQRKDGTLFPVELSVSEVGHLPLFTGIVHDITRRKELEREVVEMVSLEQRRIGQDLHDSVAQELTALNLLAEDLAVALRTDPDGGAALIARIAGGLRRSQDQLRAVLRGLVPVAVDAGGLMAALADLADRTGREGKTACTFDCPDAIPVADHVIATEVYLIAQEAVRNAVKHARPRGVRITLDVARGLTLRVRDDGTGMGPRTDMQGLGLRIMRDRAAIIGAVLTIEPAAPTGTVVTCTLARGTNGQQPAREEGPGPDRR